MQDKIDRCTFTALAARVAAALRPHVTPAELSLVSARLRVHERFLDLNQAGPITTLHVIEDMDAERPTLRIEDILIAEARRGEGLGTAVSGAIRDYCAEQSLELNLSANPLEDEADPARPAAMERLIRYYERLGFASETSRRDGNMIIEAPAPTAAFDSSP